MFCYTQSPGGIRRGPIWQSSGKITHPAYTNWKDGLFIGDTLSKYGGPIAYKNDPINVIENGDGYKVIKFDKFIPKSDKDFIESALTYDLKRVSPYGHFSGERFNSTGMMIGFPFRIYGYTYQSYAHYQNGEQIIDDVRYKDYVNNLYTSLKSRLSGYSLTSFPAAKNVISYQFKPFIEAEKEIIYNAQDANFNSLKKSQAEPLYDEYIVEYSDAYDRVYADYPLFENNQMKMILSANFGAGTDFISYWDNRLMIPKIVFLF